MLGHVSTSPDAFLPRPHPGFTADIQELDTPMFWCVLAAHSQSAAVRLKCKQFMMSLVFVDGSWVAETEVLVFGVGLGRGQKLLAGWRD